MAAGFSVTTSKAARDNTLWLGRCIASPLSISISCRDQQEIVRTQTHNCSRPWARGSRVRRAAAATTSDDDKRAMAQVSIVTAARRELQAAALNPDAREFLPWWRLGGSRKQLSVDAPEFIPTTWGKATAAAAARGVLIVRPNNSGTGRAARRPANNSRQDAYTPRNAFFKSHRSQWDETVKRTIFVKYIDHIVTEETLAGIFRLFGTVVDCRICGHPASGDGLRFGFVELQHEDEALASLDLDGTIIGINSVSVSRSRTAICPINPKFLPQSEAEWETCLRTIYCTNISKIVTSSNLKAFCEAYFGKVCRLKLLDNEDRSTNIAFIEFAEVDGAIAALMSGGIYVDGIPIRMCPSKSPIRTYCFGSPTALEGTTGGY